ncbi:hypothetical protein SSX86_002400 [Deinandra increscens subsp. villosa]|uniref:Dof zinc finger protein n=1 Tax=Deinandra increscens subsp. villosa TaxID=3103831 RepID=A0AAP0H7Z3_9ASTR
MHPFPSPSDMNPSNKFPEHEHLKCPRCDSSNTKFCYYNNYNLSQPRHFCKNCRRYWTKGGTLRNIPIGGGTRKIAKRSSNSTKRTLTATATAPAPATSARGAQPEAEEEAAVRYRSGSEDHQAVESGGYPMGPFGNLLMEGLNFNLVSSRSDEDVLIRNPIAAAGDFRSNFLRLNDNDNGNGNGNGNGDDQIQNDVGGIGIERGDSSCWNGGENGWPDLSIFTPGSSFH